MAGQLLVLLLAATLQGHPGFSPLAVHSTLATGQRLVVGSRQPGSFQLMLRNGTTGPLLVAERQPDGAVRERCRLAPQQRKVLRFPTGTVAVVGGLAAQPAAFDAVLSSREADDFSVKYETP